MNNNVNTQRLAEIGLSAQEAEIYYELLKSSGLTRLQLSRTTGIQRNKVYRLVDDLLKRGLIHIQTDDTGTKVHAAKPDALESILVDQEQALIQKKETLNALMPSLKAITDGSLGPLTFKVKTYDGVEGFKQMIWNDLKAVGTIYMFGAGTLEDLVESRAWCEMYRQRAADAGYIIRELQNNTSLKSGDFSEVEEYVQRTNQIRYLPAKVLDLRHTITVYNDTVATYCYQDGQKVGLEIINSSHANFYRQLFHTYWDIAGDLEALPG